MRDMNLSTADSILAEIGNLSRFESPCQLKVFPGPTPYRGQDSPPVVVKGQHNGPDATVTLDFLLARLAGVVESIPTPCAPISTRWAG